MAYGYWYNRTGLNNTAQPEPLIPKADCMCGGKCGSHEEPAPWMWIALAVLAWQLWGGKR